MDVHRGSRDPTFVDCGVKRSEFSCSFPSEVSVVCALQRQVRALAIHASLFRSHPLSTLSSAAILELGSFHLISGANILWAVDTQYRHDANMITIVIRSLLERKVSQISLSKYTTLQIISRQSNIC
jgi:hypothetical protein